MKRLPEKTIRTVILHIGPPKTGSRSIQTFLYRARTQLLEHRVLYPASGRLRSDQKLHVLRPRGRTLMSGPGTAHHLLPWTLLRETEGLTAAQCWTGLQNEIEASDAAWIVISSEAFSRLRPAEIQAVHEYLSGYDVKIIMHAREPFSKTLSNYNHLVKYGRCRHSFRSYVSEITPTLSRYDQFIYDWEQCFGREKILVRQFDSVKKTPGLVIDFLSIFCPEPEIFHEFLLHKPLNLSPSASWTNVLRGINQIEYSIGHPRILRPFFRAVRRIVRAGGTNTWLNARQQSQRPLFTQEDVDLIRELANDSYQKICDRYTTD